MVALVVTECVLQYSLALSNLLQRPSIDLVEVASEAETVISSLRRIRQDDNVWHPRSSRVSIINARADLNMLSASALLDHRVSHKPFTFLRPSRASNCSSIPEAYYVHCYVHCLNLAVVKSC
jgi:hypothetical protein